MTAQALTADGLVDELTEAPRPAASAIQRVKYTHEAMIDLIISDPWISQGKLAAHFGYTDAWVSRIIASDAFQEQLAKRRSEVIDPAIKATIEERFKALVVLSLEVLHKKLSSPNVSDNVALRAAELGAKALGVGGHAPPPPPAADRLNVLAERLLILQANVRNGAASLPERVVDGQVIHEGLPGSEVGAVERLQSDAGQPAETAV